MRQANLEELDIGVRMGGRKINGDKIEDSGYCKGDILRRLPLGRAAMTGLNKLWKDTDITITTKCRIVNALVFPVVLYRCESCTIKKQREEELTYLSCGAGEDCYEYQGLQDELTNQLLNTLKLETR